MISLENRDVRKKVEQGFNNKKREMGVESELEEGEACSYNDDNDTATIDPDVSLSYIDEKLQSYLGHFKKDFEGVVSAESLGAKFGVYGSFLPAHRRSPHSRTPPRVQNHNTQSLNTLQAEGGHFNALPPANVSSSIKQGSASVGSASSYAYKPPPQNDLSRQNTSTKSIQLLEERTPKSEVRDQKTLKVRIKVGSESLSVKKNAAIYSGLGLDGSPTSSRDDSPMENKRLSCRLSFDGLESPTHILQMMMSSPLFDGCLLSPLQNDLMCLRERSKHSKDFSSQLSSKANQSFSVKQQEIVSGVKSKGSMDKKKLFPHDAKDGKDSSISSPVPVKEIGIDVMSCEELVSNALKLPLLSNAPNAAKGSRRASWHERDFIDASNGELLEPVSIHANLSEKPKEIPASSGKHLHNKVAIVGDIKTETEDRIANVSTSLKSQKVSKIGLKDPVNQGSDKSTSHSDDIVLPSAIEQSLSGDEKRLKKSQVHGFSSKQIVIESNNDNVKLKDTKFTNTENNARRNDVQKDLTKSRDLYVDVFGEMNEPEVDIMDSPDVATGGISKSFDDVATTTLACENTFGERGTSLEAHEGVNPGVKLKGSSNIASVSKNVRLMFEAAPIPIDGNDNWVQCDQCQKWRMLPPGSKVDNLPVEWDCSLMTWLPDRNHCSVSEEESNNFHAHPPGMTAANNFSALPMNEKNTSKVRKTSKASFLDSPNRPPAFSWKKQDSVKENTLKEVKEPRLMNGIGHLQQQPKSSDKYQERGQHNITDKLGTDDYSEGGHAKVSNRKSRKGSDQEVPRVSKKSKTQSMQRGDSDRAASHDQDVDILGFSSDFGYEAASVGKNWVSNSGNFASQNSKDDMSGIAPDTLGKLSFQVEQIPTVGSVHVSKSGSGNKKRKGDNFKDPPSSTPLSGKIDDDEKSSRKRHKISKSEGKESSSSKKSGKVDKKSKKVSHFKLNSNETLPKDSVGVNLVVAATSSSSKVSGSLKVKCKFQEVKGSPVESVSSSPLKIPNSDKLTSESKVMVMNDNVQDDVKMETSSPRRCSTADYEGSGDQSGPSRKDLFATNTFHGSPNYSVIDIQNQSKGNLQLTNGNGCIGNVNLGNGYPSKSQASNRCLNETARGELQFDANISNSGKSWKYSPSLSKDKNQNSKSNTGKGKVKASGSYENSLDHTSIYKEKEHDKKIKVDEKCLSNVDKSESCTIVHNKEPSLPKSERSQEHDKKKNSKKFEADKSEEVVPVHAKEKSLQLLRSDGDKNEMSNLLQPCQGSKARSSAGDTHPDGGLPRESRLNKKSDSHNGAQLPSKHPISNGHKIKNQDVPSHLRKDFSNQAASSAIKEAKDLKHLADRLKSSGSVDSTGMYFEAALKFLHGASLLESGRTENIKHADIAQSMHIYSSTANLCQFCAHEFERSKDMATAALAYKCMEVAYLRVIYSSHNNASRDRHELQHALQIVPPGESPSSSASDIDNLNNSANGDRVIQARNGDSPQLAANLVIAAKNRPNFSRLLAFALDVNSAMEASRKSRIAFAAASGSMGHSDSNDEITAIKRALDFNFHDVDGLLHLVRLAKEAISR